MICNIVGGSPEIDIDIIKHYQADTYIGVDYGAYVLMKNNVQLDVAIGDFDSINTKELVDILNSSAKVYRFDKDKDKTDTELAFEEAIKLGATHVNLFGVTGRRIDHFLGTLNLFNLMLKKKLKIQIIDAYNRISILEPGKHAIKKTDYDYISLFSYKEEVKNLTLTGFKYNLESYTLKNLDSLCVSNEVESDDATISFDKGFLLVVESSD